MVWDTGAKLKRRGQSGGQRYRTKRYRRMKERLKSSKIEVRKKRSQRYQDSLGCCITGEASGTLQLSTARRA